MIIGLIIYSYNKEGVVINYYDYFDFYLIALTRLMIIAVKYGYFSKQSMNLIRHSRPSRGFLYNFLVRFAVVIPNADQAELKVDKALANIQIDERFFKIYTEREDADMDERVMERLRDLEKMKEYYSDGFELKGLETHTNIDENESFEKKS